MYFGPCDQPPYILQSSWWFLSGWLGLVHTSETPTMFFCFSKIEIDDIEIHMAMGQNPVPPVNIPIPTKIGSKTGGEFTYQPKWDPKTVLTTTPMSSQPQLASSSFSKSRSTTSRSMFQPRRWPQATLSPQDTTVPSPRTSAKARHRRPEDRRADLAARIRFRPKRPASPGFEAARDRFIRVPGRKDSPPKKRPPSTSGGFINPGEALTCNEGWCPCDEFQIGDPSDYTPESESDVNKQEMKRSLFKKPERKLINKVL